VKRRRGFGCAERGKAAQTREKKRGAVGKRKKKIARGTNAFP